MYNLELITCILPQESSQIVYSNLFYHLIYCSTCNPASPSTYNKFGQETHLLSLLLSPPTKRTRRTQRVLHHKYF